MQVAYDGHIFRWQKVGGVSRYFREVISRLPRDWTPAILGEAAPQNLPAHPRLIASGLSSLRPRSLSQPLKVRWWEQRHLSRAQVFHPTYYGLTGGLSYARIKCPVVVTVHDLISATYPQLEDDGAATTQGMRMALDRADHAICVSRATERDLLTHFPHMAGKTSVIYHGTSFEVVREAAPPSIFEVPVFLFVGRRSTYKNFALLLRAFARACQSHPTMRLCAAGGPLTEEEKWQIHFLGISGRVDAVAYPSEEKLEQLYQGSVALLYPSRHEGFGIPALEAMACGTLAVTANTTSLPEVVGDAGIMLDPADEAAWTDCMLAIATDKVRRSELLERGRRRATEFSWEATAAKHAAEYRRLALASSRP
ncbi:MAG: glycosyltransferase family 4 protein [Opitutaceae bacterium]|nr:glycosyltransferase family 4 protein [Opitutaceae bacterium]